MLRKVGMALAGLVLVAAMVFALGIFVFPDPEGEVAKVLIGALPLFGISIGFLSLNLKTEEVTLPFTFVMCINLINVAGALFMSYAWVFKFPNLNLSIEFFPVMITILFFTGTYIFFSMVRLYIKAPSRYRLPDFYLQNP